MEMADVILVNKADGALKETALRTCADYAGALRLLRKRPQDPDGFPKALTVSAAEEAGLDMAWDEIRALAAWRRDAGHFAARRAEQARGWFEEEVRQGLMARLAADPAIRAEMDRLGAAVQAGKAAPARAAAAVLAALAP
jgi:LAO/AO transport system kinase